MLINPNGLAEGETGHGRRNLMILFGQRAHMDPEKSQ